jgi:hypothetical protein
MKDMDRMIRLMLFLLLLFFLTALARAKPPNVGALKLSEGILDVVKDVANIFAGVCGFVGFGITAWQMATGSMHSLNHLLYAVAGYAVANFAATLI